MVINPPPTGAPTPPGGSAVQWALQQIFEQIVRYGLATVLAVMLVGLLVYERVETDKNQTALIGKVIELQVASNRVAVDTQTQLAAAVATQGTYVKQQDEMARTLSTVSTRQEETLRRLESLQGQHGR